MLVRNSTGEAIRTIYFTSPLVRSLLTSNSYNRMRLISCGVKIFMRQDATRDVAGVVERIGPQRWRLVLPYPRFESLIDVVELVPKT